MFEVKTVSAKVGNREMIIETGKYARQASGSVMVTYGDTKVLVTACVGAEKEGIDFLPLTVDYIEKMYAAGKIPGGFFKREGRPTEKETLTSRFIDRPIRPLFKDGWNCETQITATVVSAEVDCDPDVVAMTGASAALALSSAPFLGPIAGCRVCRIKGDFVLNPSKSDQAESDINLIVAASKDALVMVEGGADEVSEEDMTAALLFAFEGLQPIIKVQEELKAKAGQAEKEFTVVEENTALKDRVNTAARDALLKAVNIHDKLERYAAIDELKSKLKEEILTAESDDLEKAQFSAYFGDLKKDLVRNMIVKEGRRIDGRDLKTVRPIQIEGNVLPRSHGSVLFTRGETQALVAVTLGIPEDVQYIDNLLEDTKKSFMLHYNFPPFSVGETRPLRSPGRREIGHGALAERSVEKILPGSDYPYVIRVVSEILESNGSSSMASVCGGSLALMTAGVPVKRHVAGVAMGLIQEGNDIAILTDILGDEDHLGDMDFKVTGTTEGICALQMDIKITGVTKEILTQALAQAKEARLHILNIMNEAIPEPASNTSKYAPRIVEIKIKQSKIREVIGQGGKVIKGIVEETGVKMNVEDDGTVTIYSSDEDSLMKAKAIVEGIVEEAQVDRVYRGKVKKIMDFGAFVEILPNTDGLVHISQLAPQRVEKVTDVVNEGDVLVVKCIGIDARTGKISLSLKQAEGLTPDKEK